MRPWIALPLLLAACEAPGRPRIEAHRGGAGYHPQNSRSAVLATLEDGWDALEIDLALTADGIPVLSHDPWVHPTLCERVDGAPVGERVRIDQLTAEALQTEYLCGGLPDPEFPLAQVLAEPILTLDELLGALRGRRQDLMLHLDLKFEPGWTPPADALADAVLSRWAAADLPNPTYVSANTPEAVLAAEVWGRAHGIDIQTSLIWPRFPVDSSSTGVGLGAELAQAVGLADPLALADAVDADGLCLYWELARRPSVALARRRGFEVQLWTLNDRDLLRHHARWPVDALITDYPGDLP